MATLYLGEVELGAPTLLEWLDGNWSFIFSHPADFDAHGFERDRWLEIVRDECRERCVRPIAYRGDGAALGASWVDEVVEDDREVRLQRSRGVEPLAERNLRADLIEISTRFVMIIDEQLRRRGVLSYGVGRTRVSPLDLLSSVTVLRGGSRLACAA